jgi:hypothetical protein
MWIDVLKEELYKHTDVKVRSLAHSAFPCVNSLLVTGL